MIAFGTMILTLVVGVVPIELVAATEVAAIEVVLDGRSIARLEDPPWEVECDFGSALLPHSLLAIGYDDQGKEIGRVRQWVNTARPRAEIDVVVEDLPQGGAIAKLAWESVLAEAPSAIAATFDGVAIDVDGSLIAIPPFDRERAHFLRVEATFANELTAVTDVMVGGLYGDEASTQLTAVLVELTGRGRAPSAGDMDGWFLADGVPLTVVGVEKGEADIVIVRDRQAQWQMNYLARVEASDQVVGITPPPGSSASQGFGRNDSGSSPGVATSVRTRLRFERDQQVRLLSATPNVVDDEFGERRVFPRSDSYRRSDGGLLWLLATREADSERSGSQPLADAVAAAGQSAAERHRRRAVVLVTSGRDHDTSELTPGEVRRYLEAVRVPLAVWATSPGGPQHWGEAVSVAEIEELRRAQKRLIRGLERQRLVWVRGAHLPHRIELAAAAEGVVLVR